jgi:Asp-tRNA(Asn)/Glu-tRNA(Gln) amidotransferase A subunit family amidase
MRFALCVTLCAALMTAVDVTRVSAQRPGAPTFEVFEVGIAQLQDALANGRVTSVQLVQAYLARIEAYDRGGARLNAVIRLNPAAADDAARLDAERAMRGPRGPLHGIPILLKDNFDTQDMPTTASTLGLAGHIPPDDAFQVRRLRDAGAIILGKTNLHELASGIVTISSLGGATRNPYDPSRNPGGSSGGTGAAIAASFAAIGWGTDTCGSIRIPAAHQNLFGLRPTKGLSSTDGIVPLSHTQDVAGPLARTVSDLAIGLDATIGFDPADTTTVAMRSRTVRFAQALDTAALRGVRLGILEPLFGSSADDQEAGRIVRAAAQQLERQGATLVSVPFPLLDSLIQGTAVIDHEFKFDLIDYLAASAPAAVRSLDDILSLGLYHVALEERMRQRNAPASRDTDAYRNALARRAALQRALNAMFDQQNVQALIYPTLRRKPAALGEAQAGSTCSLSAQTGFPALAMPAGFTADSLPIAIELLGRPFDDARLLAFAFDYEQATKPRRPPSTTPPLANGRAPAPIRFSAEVDLENGAHAQAELFFDFTRNALAYQVNTRSLPADDLFAIALLRTSPDSNVEPVAFSLAGPAQLAASATLILSPAERFLLLNGRLRFAAFTRGLPLGARADLLR